MCQCGIELEDCLSPVCHTRSCVWCGNASFLGTKKTFSWQCIFRKRAGKLVSFKRLKDMYIKRTMEYVILLFSMTLSRSANIISFAESPKLNIEVAVESKDKPDTLQKLVEAFTKLGLLEIPKEDDNYHFKKTPKLVLQGLTSSYGKIESEPVGKIRQGSVWATFKKNET